MTPTQTPDTTTDDTTTAETAAAATTGPSPDAEPADRENGSQADSEAGEDEQQAGGNEAARYRRRLRDTERERDRLAEQVTALQRREVDRLAADHLSVGGDLLALGDTALADLLGEDGHPDAGKVHAAATALTASRPGLARPRSGPTGYGLGQGSGPAGRGNAHRPAQSPSWNDLLPQKR